LGEESCETGTDAGETVSESSENSEPKKKRLSRKNKKRTLFDTESRRNRKILELGAKNVPAPYIARSLGMSTTTVRTRLAQFEAVFEELRNVESYESLRGKILTAAELKLLKSMVSPEKIAKASLNQVAYAFRQTHDARRLEHNQSTSNQAVQFTEIPLSSFRK
jgi:hypothetical protein